MKYIAAFLVFVLMLSTSAPGIAALRGEKMTASKSCLCKSCSKDANHSTKDNCSKTSCVCTISCCNCGLLKATIAFLPPTETILSNQIYTQFTTGDLSDYNGNNWNPPKV